MPAKNNISSFLIRGKNLFPNFVTGILNSYTQIFFSNNRWFALILILVTFFDKVAGMSGLLCVIFTNLLAYIIGFNRQNIISGFYGFNSLLTGLAIGSYYSPNAQFFLILAFASLLSLFLTLLLEGVVGKYGLPFLSLPFLLAVWMLILATRQFTSLEISERGIYVLNEMYALGGMPLVNLYKWFSEISLPGPLVIYFRSLGAIFFQYYVFAGILLAIGLLIYSRIAFLLSLVGFFSAYLFYRFIGADINELNYNYIGFNFILTAIAVGGFFIVSSRYSFVWVVLLTPLISITITSTSAIMGVYQLPVYSLPFNAIVLLFLYAMKFRERFTDKPQMVLIQHFSPEKNLYKQQNNRERFRNAIYFPFALPFWGEWKVTQGHNGNYTHKEDWRHAWDFEITDGEGKTFKGSGTRREDYYCFNKPVVAPLGGIVEELQDGVEDNPIGEINTGENWGNTIVIKHAEGLYSKISHFKKESFRVQKGDQVKKGDIIGYCGNSGRSPQPHIHFQFQATPFIGSKTLDYPFGHYILCSGESFTLKSFDKPSEGDVITAVEKNQALYRAFRFIPGQEMKFRVSYDGGKKEKTYTWEVVADLYNNTFIWCKQSRSRLYFRTDDDMMYFTHFEGRKRSLLYYFYLASYKVLYGYYQNLELHDVFPVDAMNSGPLIILQDFLAPFFMFLKTRYTLNYLHCSDDFSNSEVRLSSDADMRVFGIRVKKLEFSITVSEDQIGSFEMSDRKNKAVAVRINEEYT